MLSFWLFFVEQIGLSLLLEFFYVVLPHGFDFFGTFSVFNHLAHVVYTYQFLEKERKK